MPRSIITEEYCKGFMIADAAFKHQIVFDPIKRELVPLTDQNVSGEHSHNCENIGDVFDNQLAFQLALGNIDPFTKEMYDDWLPDNQNNLPITSIWSKNYKRTQVTDKTIQTSKFKETISKQNIETFDTLRENKLEYDLQLEKELERYKVFNYTVKEQKIGKEPCNKDEKTSPILSRTHIPFKKLSKFQRTQDIFTATRSPFFSKQNSEIIVSKHDSLLGSIDKYNNKNLENNRNMESTLNITNAYSSNSCNMALCDKKEKNNITPIKHIEAQFQNRKEQKLSPIKLMSHFEKKRPHSSRKSLDFVPVTSEYASDKLEISGKWGYVESNEKTSDEENNLLEYESTHVIKVSKILVL